MLLTDAKDLATIVVGVIALITLAKGVVEYIRQGAQKRAEMYIDFEKRFLENEKFREICHLLETDDVKLKEVPFGDKLHFLGFFEQVALLLNSNLIRVDVAHYMFGYYAVQAEKSKHFWTNMDRDNVYWSLFSDFAKKMQYIEASFQLNNRRLRF